MTRTDPPARPILEVEKRLKTILKGSSKLNYLKIYNEGEIPSMPKFPFCSFFIDSGNSERQTGMREDTTLNVEFFMGTQYKEDEFDENSENHITNIFYDIKEVIEDNETLEGYCTNMYFSGWQFSKSVSVKNSGIKRFATLKSVYETET